MRVLLVHPPEGHVGVPPEAERTQILPEDPGAWDLLCLARFLLGRTRHQPLPVNLRGRTPDEAGLRMALRDAGPAEVAVIRADPAWLPSAARVRRALREDRPDLPLVLIGPHPTWFPEEALALDGGVAFAVAGDPELVLRPLLDHWGNPKRVHHIPGLQGEGFRSPAVWTSDPSELSLPSAPDMRFLGHPHDVAPALRLTRGPAAQGADPFAPDGPRPPLNWPVAQVAARMAGGSGLGLSGMHVADPPGHWTPATLAAWTDALGRADNRLPWQVALRPFEVSTSQIEDLKLTHCHRVVFAMDRPGPEPAPEWRKWLPVWSRSLAEHGIDAVLRIRVGGPAAAVDEQVAAILGLAALAPECRLSVVPLPFSFTCPYLADTREDLLRTWGDWMRAPLDTPFPGPPWGWNDAAAKKIIAGVARHRGGRHRLLRRIRGLPGALRSTVAATARPGRR